MNILGIETSSEICGVALLAKDREFSLQRSARRRHSEILMELVEEVLHRSGLRYSDIQALAVDVGPGSYTGLRIGIMTAKALSFALVVPAAPVPSLLALAHSVAVPTAPPFFVAPCLAGLGTEVYTAVYKRKGEGLTKLEDFRRIGIEEWLEHLSRRFLPGHIFFSGSGARRHKSLILREGFRISPRGNPHALWIARLGRSQLLMQAVSRPLNPIYLTRRVILSGSEGSHER